MSDRISLRGIDPEGVADGDYTLTVAGGHVTGLTAASAGSGGGGGSTDTWHQIGAAGEPAFQNSWVNYGSGEQPAAFTKIGGVVYLTGIVQGGTGIGASPMFTLPVGYRPPNVGAGTNAWNFTQTSNAAFARLAIFPNGLVIPVTGSSANFWLTGTCFPAA